MGGGVPWIFGHSLLKILDRSSKFCGTTVPVVTAFEVRVVCLWIYWMPLRNSRFINGGQFDLNLAGDGLCHFRMQSENVSEIAVIVLSPQVNVSTGIH